MLVKGWTWSVNEITVLLEHWCPWVKLLTSGYCSIKGACVHICVWNRFRLMELNTALASLVCAVYERLVWPPWEWNDTGMNMGWVITVVCTGHCSSACCQWPCIKLRVAQGERQLPTGHALLVGNSTSYPPADVGRFPWFCLLLVRKL